MSDCCGENSHEQPPKQHICPIDAHRYSEVPYETVLHHLTTPWKNNIKIQPYYFCSSPDCDVVYFGLDNSTINRNQLKTEVGVKESNDEALICYCFDVSRLEATNSEQAKLFVIEQTKKGACACKTFNPSGKCCLKDFPKLK